MSRWPAEWRRSVLRDHRINNFTRVVLLVLADAMNDDGTVSLSRSKLAKMLDVHPSRVTEAVQAAHDAGLLRTVVKGEPGVTAVYSAARSDGAPLVTNRRASRGGYGRTMPADETGSQHGRNTAPCDGAPLQTMQGGGPHAQHGAPERLPITTEPQRSDLTLHTASTSKAAFDRDRDGHPTIQAASAV